MYINSQNNVINSDVKYNNYDVNFFLNIII